MLEDPFIMAIVQTIIMCQRVLSQQASGTCDVSQFFPDRLVQSITGVAVQLQLVNGKQNNIIPDNDTARMP